MLDNIRAYTSREDFIANNIYKVVSRNFSPDGSIDLAIEGDISSFDYSLALISMLPIFEKLVIDKKLKLRYYNLSDKNLEEAKMIEAVNELYPDKIVEYLLFKSECLFSFGSHMVFEELDISIKLINQFLDKPSNTNIVKNKFVQSQSKDYSIKVNDYEFDLIPAFYLDSKEEELLLDNSKNGSWGYLYCLSYNLHDYNKFRTKAFGKRVVGDELIHTQNDIYVALVACSQSSSKDNFLKKTYNRIRYGNQLIANLTYNGYSNLSNYLTREKYIRCKEKPLECYYQQIQKETNQEKK